MAIVIGAYALSDFVRLNVTLCRSLWPFAPILISDDKSDRSGEIEKLADEHGIHYICSNSRRTHTSGDFQAFINGAVFGLEQEVPWVLKLSQRFVPLQGFAEWLELELVDGVDAVLPGKLLPGQIARPGAGFYLNFGHLTDCVCFRPNVFTPAILKEEHDAGMSMENKASMFSELIWYRLMNRGNVRRIDWMANHEIGKPKLYLRKATAQAGEFFRLAESLGIKGFFDCREWKAIEGPNYRSIPL